MNSDKAPDSSVSPRNPSTCLLNEPFNPMAFLKMWGDKMQSMHFSTVERVKKNNY